MTSFISKHFWLVLALLALFAMFLELGRMDVCTDNEGQRATPPAEMLRSGRYLVPTINGVTYLAKPPLLYWAIAGVYTLTGEISAFTARIPTATCAVALILALYFVFRRKLGELPARWAAIALLASPYFLERSRWAELDVPLTLATFLAITACWTAFETDTLVRRAWFTLLAGFALGAAIMLKGPAPLLFLGAAWAGFLLTRNAITPAGTKRLLFITVLALILEYILKLTGILAFPLALAAVMLYSVVWAWRSASAVRVRVTAITAAAALFGVLLAAPWAVAVLKDQGWENIRNLLSSEVVTRTHTASDINSGSPLYYLIALPVLMAPWSLLFPFHLSRSEWRDNKNGYRFCIATAWLSILVFSLIAGKEYEYILPAFPFLAGATGLNITRFIQGRTNAWIWRWGEMWSRVCVAVIAVLALAAIVYVLAANRQTALIVEIVALGTLAVGAGIWSIRRVSHRPHAIALQALLVILAGLLATRTFHYIGPNSPREIAETTGRLLHDGYRVEAGWFRYPFTPAFVFYAGTPVPVQVNYTLAKERLADGSPYFYLVRKSDLEKSAFPLDPSEYQLLMGPYTSKQYLMLGNTPLPASVPHQDTLALPSPRK